MKSIKAWQGVRMRRTVASPEPDGVARAVTLPAAWDHAAAAALAGLAPGSAPVRLDEAAEAWIRPVGEHAARAGLDGTIADRLRALLLARRGAAGAAAWRGGVPICANFVLNLASFFDPGHGLDVAGFAGAAATAVTALTLLAPAVPRIGVGMADLAGLLAALGLDYDSQQARDAAAALAALLRAVADTVSADMAERFGAVAEAAAVPAAPAATVLPGLAEAARAAQAEAALRPARRHEATTAIGPPGAAEALLGVETGGIAPAFSPLDDAGALTRTARVWLAARGLGGEAALAALLAGRSPFPASGPAAHAAMHDAVAPFVHAMPPRPEAHPLAPPASARPRRELPARRTGSVRRASVGGQKLVLGTAEYADGELGEVAIQLLKAAPAMRALMENFAQAVSLGLQHGVPLEEFVETFTGTCYGPAGVVEGDPAVRRASSLVDYVFRNLAATYLGRTDIPEPLDDSAGPEGERTPLLPLELPRHRGLRLVK
jgi:hypothetical protein